MRRPGLAKRTARLAAVFVLAAMTTGVAPAQEAPDTLAGPALRAALRAGGYTLYFRHTATDFSQSDERYVEGDCASQRNLTDAGRDDARAIGAAIRRLRLPVGDVLASAYCRTMETATLMFGRATPSPAVRGGPAQAPPERYADLRRLLATPPRPGTLRVIASHGNPFRAITDAAYLSEGEAAVVAPREASGFKVVARVRKDEWDALAR